MMLGIERLLVDRVRAATTRVALVAHPASVTYHLKHSLDALSNAGSAHYRGIQSQLWPAWRPAGQWSEPRLRDLNRGPVFGLWGVAADGQSMSTFDTVLIDLQDLGCRIYTFITTLLYMLEAAAEHKKSVWVLDRPNPAGRPIEGLTLRQGWESFVGAGPIPMRHGLTLGELGRWFVDHFKLDVDYRVIEMEDYRPDEAPGFGWPADHLGQSSQRPNLNIAVATRVRSCWRERRSAKAGGDPSAGAVGARISRRER
jgi:uncharacterized protein YbbC (DUF1343 family)